MLAMASGRRKLPAESHELVIAEARQRAANPYIEKDEKENLDREINHRQQRLPDRRQKCKVWAVPSAKELLAGQDTRSVNKLTELAASHDTAHECMFSFMADELREHRFNGCVSRGSLLFFGGWHGPHLAFLPPIGQALLPVVYFAVKVFFFIFLYI